MDFGGMGSVSLGVAKSSRLKLRNRGLQVRVMPGVVSRSLYGPGRRQSLGTSSDAPIGGFQLSVSPAGPPPL